MKNWSLTFLLFFVYLSGWGQTTQETFSSFLKGLPNISVPFTTSKILEAANFNEANKRLSKLEWSLLRLDNKSWPFLKNYSYESIGKLPLGNNLTGVIYSRAYLPPDIKEEKKEVVLAIFTKEGKLISTLPIHGMHGDNLNFLGEIDRNYIIKIYSETYIFNKGKTEIKKETERYAISSNGLIKKSS